MIKVGVIGCGFMGGMHLNCYKEMADVKVVAVADAREEFLQKAVEITGAIAFNTGIELIEQADVDVIDICLPTFLHTKHALLAMQKGRNVFIEKPVCLSVDEGRELLAMQKKTGQFVQVGQVIRFWDEYVFLKEIIDTQKYGAIKDAHFSRISPSPNWGWENWLHNVARCGGAGLDLHIHDSDFMLSVFGAPNKINSVKNTVGEKNGYVCTQAIYDNFVVVIEGGWDFPENMPFEMSYRVAFERATITFSSINGLHIYPVNGDVFVPELKRLLVVNSKQQGGNISSLGAYYNELAYYISCIKNNTEPTKATLESAVNSVHFVLEELR